MIPKFRAWDKENDRMIYPSNNDVYFNLTDDGISIEDLALEPYDGVFPLLDSVLMQSTGLKGKNGVEIFEGDVVKVSNHPFQKKEDSPGIEIDGNYLINWSEHSLTWLAGDLLLYQLKPYIEVIGNVWEDGDLINDGKGAEEN